MALHYPVFGTGKLEPGSREILPGTMPDELIERLRAELDTFNRTGRIGMDLFDPEIEVIQASSIIDSAGVFHGEGGLRDVVGELREAFDDLRFEAEDVLPATDGRIVVFIRVHGRGKGSGMQMDNAIAWIATAHDGKFTRVVVYEERADALAAAGLTE